MRHTEHYTECNRDCQGARESLPLCATTQIGVTEGAIDQ